MHFWPDELVLIDYRHRTDSMQPEKNIFLYNKRKNMCWAPFSSVGRPNGRTERAQIKSGLMAMDITVDGGGHVLRTNTLLCRGMRKGHRW